MKKIFIAAALSLASLTHAENTHGAWGLYDFEQNQYQIVHNRSDIRSIASITKLFTANTILRAGLDLDERVKVQGRAGGRFPKGTMVTRMDLMKAMLISSDNLAAETLAKTYPGGFDQFIQDTNEWVRGWGLIDTTIVDASGLLAGNQSTVDNLTYFLLKIKDDSIIRRIASEEQETLRIPKGKKTITVRLKNTNPVIFQFDNILISKTGTTNAAGRCLVMLVEKNHTLHTIVILGQRNGAERVKIAQALINVMPIRNAEAKETQSIFEIKW